MFAQTLERVEETTLENNASDNTMDELQRQRIPRKKPIIEHSVVNSVKVGGMENL